jgi:hypothetical protein
MGLFLSRRAVGYFPLLLRGCAIRLSTLARQSLEIWNGEEKRKPLVNAQTYGNDRNDHTDSTASRLLSEVKQHRAQLVLRWGTTLESWVLFFSNLATDHGGVMLLSFGR